MLALGTASFLCFGVLLVLVGANQAELAGALSLDLSETGLLGAALALGLGIGVVGAGPLFDRYPRRPLFAGSLLLAGGALVTVEASMGFPRAFAHVMLAGLGAGAYDTLINAIVVERFRERAARPMSLVHAGATLGAVLGPFLVGWLAAQGSWASSFHYTGAAHLLLAGVALAVPLPPPPAAAARRKARREARGLGLVAVLWPFAAVAFAYVGVEASLTIFAVPYAESGLALELGRGRGAISGFWLGLLLGRLGALALPSGLGSGALLTAGAASCAALAVGVGLGVTQVELVFAAVGLTLGCVYPVMITLAVQAVPHARGTAAGLAAGAGALGGFAIPWLTGAIGDGVGPALAVGSLAAWCLVIAAAAAGARRRPARSP